MPSKDDHGMAQPIGKVYLVGAGPGDPGLLTLKGKTLLEAADVVVYDALVSEPILAMINPQADRIYGGKRSGRHSLSQTAITQLLIDQAQDHAVVVRLKGGDPFIFGRGGEEMAGLLAAGVPVEVVPGITAGVAAAAYAGIPLTHRGYSSSTTFVTGHEMAGKYRPQVNWQAIAQGSETIVVYMGIHNLTHITTQLQEAGLAATTPIALIRWGTRPQQEELVGTLGTIVAQVQDTGFSAPAIAVIGAVVQLQEQFRQCRPTVLGQLTSPSPELP
ncbi:uroporphyrinogen-III C-methyltransferase [Prochlorothrix hollandica]|uniref:uroporphyrinogen-III C-methyltransferase n=1 Tax=Prochlorothrix hollandica PCC 9006 = CALU 1027 TaxID=317619 RepID=A0A0M2PQ59_PROHO|nr:uroporphyrinogen-III C-methyltransferase [Prochlorothrix hollandica]KKI98374.1 uroporphyrin-III methyltransferase [Prochlorothrix hollandica PCC 9006 = CALU 1027]